MKLDILLNGQPVDAMATIVHNLKAQRIGRELVEKLRKVIDRFAALSFCLYFSLSDSLTPSLSIPPALCPAIFLYFSLSLSLSVPVSFSDCFSFHLSPVFSVSMRETRLYLPA